MPNMKVKLVGPVTLFGHIVEAGEEVELTEKSAKSLIEEGIAEAIATENGATPGVSDDNGDSNSEGTPDDENASDEQLDGQINLQEELEKIKRALDEKFNRDALAEAAKALGVEFPYNAKKADIVEAVIAADKATVMLEA